MELTKVSSSMIYAVGYDEGREWLEVVYFKGVYRYYDVPKAIYEGLLEADSKGSYMHDMILDLYRYRQLRGASSEENE